MGREKSHRVRVRVSCCLPGLRQSYEGKANQQDGQLDGCGVRKSPAADSRAQVWLGWAEMTREDQMEGSPRMEIGGFGR
jgi:hypothetical protein